MLVRESGTAGRRRGQQSLVGAHGVVRSRGEFGVDVVGDGLGKPARFSLGEWSSQRCARFNARMKMALCQSVIYSINLCVRVKR